MDDDDLDTPEQDIYKERDEGNLDEDQDDRRQFGDAADDEPDDEDDF